MRPIHRLSKWAIAVAMAYVVGMLPSCASMGGGMRYDLLSNLSATIGELSI
jgi:hypothetical protein